LLIFGGILFVAFIDEGLVRSIGVAMVVASAFVFKYYRGRFTPEATSIRYPASGKIERKEVTPTAWLLGVATILLSVFTFMLLYKDAVDGYHQPGPVYLFVGAILFCSVVWGRIVSRLL
jgi:hypothetical protein